MTSKISLKTVGLILEALALPIMIINIALLRMPDTDIGTSTILLIASNFMFFTGLILSHLIPKWKIRMKKKDE